MTTKSLLPFLLLMSLAFLGKLPAQVFINEYSCSNLNQYQDNHNDYDDWIELYNAGTAAVDLGGYYLSDDDEENTKWLIPAGISIPAGGFQRFWASGRDEVASPHFHTNFKLTQTKNNKETLTLSDPTGAIIDKIKVNTETKKGHSYGRTTDGESTWSVFTTPTPKASNNTATAYTGYADKPDISVDAGFYADSVIVQISTDEPNADIRYTINGTEPMSFSPLYTGPITISSTTVLKAKTFSSDAAILPSFIRFNTYFINDTHTLPVISIAADQLQNLAEGQGSIVPEGTFEYFNTDQERTATTYGEFNRHGQDSWVLSQRSLDFVSRDEMGYNHSVEEKLFSLSTRTDFQRVILRAGGDDNYPADHNGPNLGSAHLRDAYIQNLVKRGGMNLDVRSGSKCIVYLNGLYWGVYDIRERVNDHDYTDYYYGQDKFNIQYIQTWGNTWAEYGGQQALNDWESLYNYIVTNNMSNPDHFKYVSDRLDVTSLADYIITNSFVVCSDWLNYNTGWWRGLDSTGTHLKWGYILWDNDASFGHYINYTGVPDTTPSALPCSIENLFNNPWSDPEGHTRVLKRLRQNHDFDQWYVSRQIDLWNTVFSCENMLQQLDSTANLIAPEMTRHAERWDGTYDEWQTNVGALRYFIEQRCEALSNGFKTCYGLTGPYDVVLNMDPATEGYIKFNSLDIHQFPWQGQYFGGVDTRLQAVVNQGSDYVFDSWQSGSQQFFPDSLNPAVVLDVFGADTITAHLRIVSAAPEAPGAQASLAAYPSVFSNSTTVAYAIPVTCDVTMRLLSVNGGFSRNLVTGKRTLPGEYAMQIDFASAHLPAGVYMLEMMAGNMRQTVKVIYQP